VRCAVALSCASPAISWGHDCARAPGATGFDLCSSSGGRARESWMAAQLGPETDTGSRDAPVEVPLDPASAPADAAPPAVGGFEWTLAPIRWGGNLAYETRRLGIAGQSRLQRVETANLRGASYVWQPWFMQVSGGLGLVAGQDRMRSEDETIPSATDSSTVTGSGLVSLFPASRFPFQATFDRSDSRASGEITSNDFTNTRVGLRQNWRSLAGDTQYTGSWDRSTLESTSFGRDAVDVFAAGLIQTSGPQTYDLSANRAHNRRTDTGEGSLIERVVARHGYRPDPMASVDSLASASNSKYTLLANGAPAENRTRFDQASTFGAWRPGQGSPVYLTGGARVFKSTIETSGGVSETDTLSGNAAANYAVSRHTNVSGAVAVTRVGTDTTSDVVSTESLAANYIPDAIPAGGFLFTWNAGVNAGNQTGGAAASDGKRSRQNAGGLLGYNLTRTSPLGETSSITYGAGQSYASIYDTVTERSDTLTNNASVSVSSTPGAASTAYASLYGADSRTRGHDENTFQLVNFQVNGQFQFTRYSLASANLTAQSVRQSTPLTPAAGFNTSTGGNLSYQHLRAFDVPRLRYTALYGGNQIQYSSRLEGDVNAPRERVNHFFEQRLDYLVGRLEFQLAARTARIDTQRNNIVYFRMNRQFGAF
jgi:hypothetical protein